MNAWTLSGLGLNLAILVMVGTWFLARRRDNAGWGDIGWAYGFGLVAVVFALLGGGTPERRLLLGAMVALWSLRLGTHLVLRLRVRGEDPRYRELREQFPKRVWRMFFGFFLLQGVLLGVLLPPLALIASNRRPGLQPIEWIGFGLWTLAVLGEAVADASLLRFRKNPANAGRVLQTGLWRLSRHPNHLCECLVWLAYFLLATAAPGGWWMLYAPLLVLLLVRRISGVPAAEAACLKSAGEAYRSYQARVPIFLPGWPARDKSAARSS